MAMVVKITLTGMAPYFELWDEDLARYGPTNKAWLTRTMCESMEVVAYYPGEPTTVEMLNTAFEADQIMRRKKCSR